MKEFIIKCPEGYTIDTENSTLECIRFKEIEKKPKFSDYDGSYNIGGFYVSDCSMIATISGKNNHDMKNTFVTQKQAKSALAMAQISQIMANDERFGGVVTDEEWKDKDIYKYCIRRENGSYSFYNLSIYYHFLAFHTYEQCDLFLKENKQLVKDYLMID